MDDISPGRLGSRSAGVQGVGLLVNIIEKETRFLPGNWLQPEPPELCPELGGEHGLVVRERRHGVWGPQP